MLLARINIDPAVATGPFVTTAVDIISVYFYLPSPPDFSASETMTSLSTPAILLRRIEFGDYDLIVTLFTLAQGKTSAIAKSAKKSVKRFPGCWSPFPFSTWCWPEAGKRHAGAPGGISRRSVFQDP